MTKITHQNNQLVRAVEHFVEQNIKVFREVVIDNCVYYQHYRIASDYEENYILPYVIYNKDEHDAVLAVD